MAPGPVVEHVNVIEDIATGQIRGVVDLFSDAFFVKSSKIVEVREYRSQQGGTLTLAKAAAMFLRFMMSADSATAPDPKGSCGLITESNLYPRSGIRTTVFLNRAVQERW